MQWDKLTSGRLPGARPSKLPLGTFELGSRVRLAWVLSGPAQPRTSLELRIHSLSDGHSQSNTVDSPADELALRSDEGLSIMGVDAGEYDVYLIQRFAPGDGPGYDVAFSLFTQSAETPQ